MTQRDASRIVARAALKNSDTLTGQERERLWKALSLVLTGEEAEAADNIAYNLSRLDANQMKFRELIQQPAGGAK